MANKFVSWLDNVPAELKKLFTNPVVDAAISGGLGLAAELDPALAPLFNGLAAAVTKAEALASAANVQSGSGAQKFALALQDAQAIFQEYETATGKVLETPQQTNIINFVVGILNNLPGLPATASPANPSTVAATTVTATAAVNKE